MPIELKIMSFNIRVDGAGDGENDFFKRTDRILNFLNEEKPDIIGFQEVSDNIRAWLVGVLDDYYIIGAGRGSDYKGEGVPIAFKKEAMNLISCETFALSNSPEIFGSYYDGTDQSKYPRIYMRALLKHNDIDDPFYIYNLHTDHIGEIARILATTQVLQDINSHDKKFFMTGDFNARPDEKAIEIITTNKKREIKDTTKELGPTYHGFGLASEPYKIDYIFTDASTEVIRAVRVEDNPKENETYISDHNPIYILANI